MRPFMLSLITRFEERSLFFKWGVILLFMFLLGWLDYLLGYEISFSIFYTLPVSLAALTLGRRYGIFYAILGGFVWLIADILAGQTYTSPLIALWNALTRILFFLLTTILLTELRQALKNQHTLARTDFTTGLLNSRAFYEVMARDLALAQRHPHPTTLIYLDVDDFKTINDTYGHLVGDELLRQVAHILTHSLRASDVAARMGGDEFALLFPETNLAAAHSLTPRLRETLHVTLAPRPAPITFSLGVLTYTPPIVSLNDLLKHADDLMYEVKRGGKNGVAFAVYGEEKGLASPPKME